MLSKLRARLTFANVVSLIALFVALGGTSVAAVTLKRNSVRSAHIKNAQVKNPDLGPNAVDSTKVGDGALLAQDFAPGQLPQGEKGEKGEKGDQGAPGPPPDTSAFYTKTESDSRFMQGSGSVRSAYLQATGALSPAQFTVDGGPRITATCGTSVSILQFGNVSGSNARLFNQDSDSASTVGNGGSIDIAPDVPNGGTGDAVVQVVWGPLLNRVTTFTASLERPSGGCPANLWVTAVTNR